MLIFKYKLDLILSPQTLVLPVNAKLLDLQMQTGTPVVWFAVTPTNRTEHRVFRFYFTGEDCGSPDGYIGTLQYNGLVWHLFERK